MYVVIPIAYSKIDQNFIYIYIINKALSKGAYRRVCRMIYSMRANKALKMIANNSLDRRTNNVAKMRANKDVKMT